MRVWGLEKSLGHSNHFSHCGSHCHARPGEGGCLGGARSTQPFGRWAVAPGLMLSLIWGWVPGTDQGHCEPPAMTATPGQVLSSFLPTLLLGFTGKSLSTVSGLPKSRHGGPREYQIQPSCVVGVSGDQGSEDQAELWTCLPGYSFVSFPQYGLYEKQR